jgi:putative aldouronate transport system substrate-binding protein
MISDITAPLASTSYSSNSMNLLRIISEAQFNYIMGKINENGWRKALEDWMSAGGASAIEEFTQAYNKENK